MRILIADDSDSIRQLIAAILARAGYRDVHQAADGAEAIELTRLLKPALLLLDINMPKMGGYDVVMRLREDVGTRGVRIILLSGDAADTKKDRALEAGIEDFILKPVDRQRLLAAVARSAAG
jgi:CheY-like chemotaxis protein